MVKIQRHVKGQHAEFENRIAGFEQQIGNTITTQLGIRIDDLDSSLAVLQSRLISKRRSSERAMEAEISRRVAEQERRLRESIEEEILCRVAEQAEGTKDSIEATVARRVADENRHMRLSIDGEIARRVSDEMDKQRALTEKEIARRVADENGRLKQSIDGEVSRRVAREGELLRQSNEAEIERRVGEQLARLRRAIELEVQEQYKGDTVSTADQLRTEEFQRELLRQVREAKAEFARQLEDQLSVERSQITDQIRADLDSELLTRQPRYMDEMSKVFPDVCRALGIASRPFEIALFLQSITGLSKQCIEIRELLEVIHGPLAASVLALQAEIAHLDQYKTHTRGLLVMQSQRITDLRKQTGHKTWMNWATSLYETIYGAPFDGDQDSTDIRGTIETRVTRLLSRQTTIPPSKEVHRKL
jgi:hypothetical protein